MQARASRKKPSIPKPHHTIIVTLSPGLSGEGISFFTNGSPGLAAAADFLLPLLPFFFPPPLLFFFAGIMPTVLLIATDFHSGRFFSTGLQ